MAIGLGKIFGFQFPENFNYPYISRSITEFWRRWHMSLSSWFRDYVYIPLGGNRVTRGKWIRNILAVWMLTGFWHGAEWNFVLWGALFGVLLLLEKMVWGERLKRLPAFFQSFYTLFLVTISFVIFNGSGLSGAFHDVAGMFGGLHLPLCTQETLYYMRSYAVLLLIAGCRRDAGDKKHGREIKPDKGVETGAYFAGAGNFGSAFPRVYRLPGGRFF